MDMPPMKAPQREGAPKAPGEPAQVGFLGLGNMGRPMALNLARAGTPLVVWNRTTERSKVLREAGAAVAHDVDGVFERAGTVLVMLANGDVIDEVLGRGTDAFERRLRGHTLVHMGTTSPDYSAELAQDVRVAGGRYVEAPVSGSVKPAEEAQLVSMVAGDPADVERVSELVRPLGRQQIDCGQVPSALRMKLSVNVFLIGLMGAPTESVHFAAAQDVDLTTLAEVLNAGPMASAVSISKISKLVEREFAAQAAVADVHYNNRLITSAARQNHVSSPLLDVCGELLAETEKMGHGGLDMAAILHAYEQRTDRLREQTLD